MNRNDVGWGCGCQSTLSPTEVHSFFTPFGLLDRNPTSIGHARLFCNEAQLVRVVELSNKYSYY